LVPLTLAVAGTAWLYGLFFTGAPEGTDSGPLDPVLLGAFYAALSLPPVAAGIAAARLQGTGRTIGGRAG
jgi:hypothetical protein